MNPAIRTSLATGALGLDSTSVLEIDNKVGTLHEYNQLYDCAASVK